MVEIVQNILIDVVLFLFQLLELKQLIANHIDAKSDRKGKFLHAFCSPFSSPSQESVQSQFLKA